MKMKSACTAWIIAALVGCHAGTEGGPGATRPGNKSSIGQAEETFTLTMPTFSTKIKQGETKVVNLGINRGKNFDQDVTLKFEGVPQGVSIDPASPVLKHGDTEAKVTVKAGDNAALGDFTVKIMGHPGKGADATNDLKLTIETK